MFPVDVVSREVSPEGGRDSHLSSVDDELSWDPEDKLLNSTSRDPTENKPTSSADQDDIQTGEETAQPDSPASHHCPGREEEKMKSRGSSLTECGPVWDETQEDETGETEETHETGEQELLNKGDSFSHNQNLETEPPSPNKQSSKTRQLFILSSVRSYRGLK